MNKKGFTMVELLAVIVIIGVLAGVGIPAVTRQLEKSKIESFNTMRLSVCDAARNKILQDKMVCVVPPSPADPTTGNCSFDISTLLTEQYLDTLKDPSDENKNCTGTVYVNSIDHNNLVDEYNIKVNLVCIKYHTNDVKITDPVTGEVMDDEVNNSFLCSNLKTKNFR